MSLGWHWCAFEQPGFQVILVNKGLSAERDSKLAHFCMNCRLYVLEHEPILLCVCGCVKAKYYFCNSVGHCFFPVCFCDGIPRNLAASEINMDQCYTQNSQCMEKGQDLEWFLQVLVQNHPAPLALRPLTPGKCSISVTFKIQISLVIWFWATHAF